VCQEGFPAQAALDRSARHRAEQNLTRTGKKEIRKESWKETRKETGKDSGKNPEIRAFLSCFSVVYLERWYVYVSFVSK
jgi:hypothetical protein